MGGWWGRGEPTGYKLAMGLEILLSRAREGDEGWVRVKEWEKVLSKLKDTGYFQKEIQGSKKYKELVENPTNFWKDSLEEEDNEDIREVVKEVDESCDTAIGGIISSMKVKIGWRLPPESLIKCLRPSSECLKMLLVKTFLKRFSRS